jgi:hypothetical protein
MNLRLMFIGMAVAALSTGSSVFAVSDDLTDGSFDSPFIYDFDTTSPGTQGIPATGVDFIGGDFSELDTFGLLLAPDRVEITWALPVGEFATEATVDFADFAGVGATDITFTGFDLANNPKVYVYSNTTVSAPEVATTFGQGFSRVDSITIEAFESFVTNVEIDTIPEPASVALLGLGGLALIRRR